MIAAVVITCALSAGATAPLAASAVDTSRTPPATISPEWMSVWPSVIARAQHARAKPLAPDDLQGWALSYAENEKALQPYEAVVISTYGVAVEPATLNGVPVLFVTPKNWTDDGRVLIYVHGGGFTIMSAHSTLFASLSWRTVLG